MASFLFLLFSGRTVNRKSFAIPVYDDTGELARYNVFKARILVRHAKDGKLYLYDVLRTKKETSRPLEQ